MRLHNVLVTAAPPAAAWAVGLRVCIPQDLPGFEALHPHLNNKGELALPDSFALSADALAQAASLRELHAFTDQKPASSRTGFSYQHIPPALRSLLAKCLGRMQRGRQQIWASFPQWPLDLSVDFLADLCAPRSVQGPTPVVLTHDLDALEGVENLARHFLDIEERVGARSCNYVVPRKYTLPLELLQEIHTRGHELGVHGFDHSNSTAFCGGNARLRRLQEGREALAAFAPVGYRAPSLLRTRPLLQELGAFYSHDSSIPTSGGLFPVPNNGCATARPFMLCGIPEIPLSMPRDGSLIFLGHSPARSLEYWRDCAEAIAASGGVVVLLTHCEARFSGNPDRLAVYRDFLDYLASSKRFVFARMHDVAQTCALT